MGLGVGLDVGCDVAGEVVGFDMGVLVAGSLVEDEDVTRVEVMGSAVMVVAACVGGKVRSEVVGSEVVDSEVEV